MPNPRRRVLLIAWLDSLRGDTAFGWRQLAKRKLTSAAGILSLGLAVGACTSAFRLVRAAVKDQAELIAVSYAEPVDLTYRSDAEMEKAYLQYVSGWMFESFGLKPALGRLLREQDDLTPHAHPGK